MDVLAGHLVPVHPVVLLPVLVLPDPETHVLPLPVLQPVVRPIPVRPLRSVQLVVLHPVPGEFARTYFRPHWRRWGSSHHITGCRKSPETVVMVNVVLKVVMDVVMVMVIRGS